MPEPTNQFLIVIGVDIESYSKKSPQQQYRAQHKLEGWIVSASKEAKLYEKDNDIRWVDTGDGGFLLFETQYEKALPFLSIFYRSVIDNNDEVTDEAKINVRSAVHCDDALKWNGQLGIRYAGNVLVTCSRILDSMNRGYSNQVVCSGVFLRKIFQSRRTVEELRMPDQVDKHGFSHEVWNIMKQTEFGIRPYDADLHDNPLQWYLDPR